MSDEFECGMRCSRNVKCRSYNLPSDGHLGNKTCEMNDQTRQSKPKDLRPLKGFIYYEKGEKIISLFLLAQIVRAKCSISESGRLVGLSVITKPTVWLPEIPVRIAQHFPILPKKITTSRGKSRISTLSYREFPLHWIFLPEFSVELLTFLKFNNFRISGQLFQKRIFSLFVLFRISGMGNKIMWLMFDHVQSAV